MFFNNDKTDAQVREDLEAKLWKELGSSSPFVMLGLEGVEDSRTRPMTVQIDGEGENRTIYFFADKRESLVTELERSSRAVAAFQSKGHDIFAHIHGNLVIDNDRAVIDRLWNSMIAPWYEGGKDDPNLVLLRFDTGMANIWENAGAEHLVQAAIDALGGKADKPNYEDNRADVQL
ncbi:pyridoxamine 5'-phosphate oxidase family protein [Sphingomicrobium sediminis]|uniref:Pyridoxamine 5'-phosphate oxidase family protein n=1 Tax=Sphingomicrobium sediminis TaxID=2950949 RepID=A0A9X2J1J8_9SPHN|nr:pyridoxamine 5'-phosphate oxidase family protein [Sphingomicrobium sediminis]MCM8556794.1 pyridoxamine 5'-phosphate oxidase family protein [Sphingomicrobium sediminis]